MAKGIVIKIGDMEFNTGNISKVKVLFRKLAHSPKLKMLQKIAEAPEGGICVQDIYKAKGIKLGQSHASILLADLRREKLVETRREGKNVYYTLNKETLSTAKDICDIAEKLTSRKPAPAASA